MLHPTLPRHACSSTVTPSTTLATALILLILAALPRALAAEDLTLERPGAILSGTLLVPQQAVAAALVLPGSGPTDRDGNAFNGVQTDAYRLLAEGLAPEGIATLRADKRGIGRSTGDPNAVTLGLYAQDAGAWIDQLRDHSGQDCVWLIGHSEGGLVALQTAAQRDDICGLILIGTPGRPASQILLEQLRAVAALKPFMPQAEKAIVSLIAGQPVPPENLPGPLIGIFAPPIQPFLMDLFAFDPGQSAHGPGLPSLIVRGGADLQISAKDANILGSRLPRAERLDLPGMTHVMKTAADDSRAANLATYRDPTLPLAAGLLPGIAGFITTRQ